MPESRSDIVRMLQEEDHFLVVSHENPDGDALGSMAALGYVLKALGKQYLLYNATGAPRHLEWLELPAPLCTTLDELDGFAASRVIVLDCGDPFRMGRELMLAIEPQTIVNIDHHAGNPQFGALNWVDTAMAAVGEMVALLARDLNVPLSGGLGESVYLAIVSDTGSFAYGNTKPETLELAADILRAGLDIGHFNVKFQNQWEMKRIRFWSEALGSASLHLDGRVGVVVVSREAMERHDVGPEDCDGLVEFVRRVRTVRVAISLREDTDKDLVKFSLRSSGADNVQQVALLFGGGGHRNAAGGAIADTLDNARDQLISAISSLINFDQDNFLTGSAHA